jgi:hypothetical protein
MVVQYETLKGSDNCPWVGPGILLEFNADFPARCAIEYLQVSFARKQGSRKQ